MSNINKHKYIKYKNKYVNLKNIIQKGGNNKFKVIPNNGGAEGMSNQCLWISLRDYFYYYKNINLSVTDIKTQSGINLDRTRNIMFDWDTNEHRQALQKICNIYKLYINFYQVDYSGKNVLYYDDPPTVPMPMHIVSAKDETDTDIPFNQLSLVNIAFYGAHFQLIIYGENIENMLQPQKEIPNLENIEIDRNISKHKNAYTYSQQQLHQIPDISQRNFNEFSDFSNDDYELSSVIAKSKADSELKMNDILMQSYIELDSNLNILDNLNFRFKQICSEYYPYSKKIMNDDEYILKYKDELKNYLYKINKDLQILKIKKQDIIIRNEQLQIIIDDNNKYR